MRRRDLSHGESRRPTQGHHRFHAQSDRLQPDPHSQIADGLADTLTTTRSPHELEDKGTEKALLSTFFR